MANHNLILKNTILLYLRMFFVMGVSLYTSRLVLNILGVEDYGIYNIVGGVVALFVFLNNAMTTATQRFLSFYLGKELKENLEKIFSASMFAHLTIVVVVVLLSETIGLFVINKVLNIPSEKVIDANWVFQASVLTLCTQIMRVPYNANIIAQEKMAIYAYLSIVEVLLKLLCVVALLCFSEKRLIIYAVCILFSNIIITLVYYFYCISKYDYCKFSNRCDKKLYLSIFSFTGWSLLGQGAIVLSNQGCNIFLNVFFGVVVNAAMGIANQVNSTLMGFVHNFQTAFKPQIVKSYAKKDFIGLHNLIDYTSRLSFYLLYVFAVPIFFYIEEILNWWLGVVPEYTNSFCLLIIAYSLFESFMGPLWISIFATGEIKKYQILMSIIYSMILVLSYVFLYIGFPPETVLIIKLLLCLGVFIIRIHFVRLKIKLNLKKFFDETVLPIIKVLSITSVFVWTFYQLTNQNLHYVIMIIMMVIINSVIIFYVGLKKNERNKIFNMLLNKIKC